MAMVTAQDRNNTHYREYVRLLKRLHELIASGQGESDAANAIRDELDQRVGYLNQCEYRRAEGLCEDLYTLVEDEPPPVSAMSVKPRSREQIASDLNVHWGRDWDRVLELLREGAHTIPLDVASYARGRCWAELGDPNTALLFLARASQLNPTNANYAVLVMNTLTELERFDEAVAIAKTCIQHTRNSRLHIKAADVLFSLARFVDSLQGEPLYRQVISITENALATEESLPPDQQLPSLAVAGYVLQGMSYEALGQSADARQSFDCAIAIDPSSDAARTARGLLTYGSDTASSVADLQIAVANETPLDWPYFFLAHHFLVMGNYRNCLAMCRQALIRTSQPSLRANLLEWTAIARCELGALSTDVEALFTSAQALAPFNARIGENMERLKQRAASASSTNWDVSCDVSPEVAVREMRRSLFDTRLDSEVASSEAKQVATAS